MEYIAMIGEQSVMGKSAPSYCTRDLHLLAAVAGALRYPEVYCFFEECGGLELLYDPVARMTAAALLYGEPLSVNERMHYYDAIEEYRIGFVASEPTEAVALHAISRLCALRWTLVMPAMFRHWATRLESGQCDLACVKFEFLNAANLADGKPLTEGGAA